MTALLTSTMMGSSAAAGVHLPGGPAALSALPGLLAAAFWGGGDFAGSYAVKLGGGTVRASLRVVVIGHLLSLLALVVAGLVLRVPLHDPRVLLWALGGGVISGMALMAFYLALANGHMGAGAAVYPRRGFLRAGGRTRPAAVGRLRPCRRCHLDGGECGRPRPDRRGPCGGP